MGKRKEERENEKGEKERGKWKENVEQERGREGKWDEKVKGKSKRMGVGKGIKGKGHERKREWAEDKGKKEMRKGLRKGKER